MKIKKGTEKEYAVFRAERTLEPDYRATLLYMEGWAEAMERELEQGATMEEAVLKTRFQNAEAITLRGYRWALRLLCYVWEYGEELKQWQRDQGLKCEKPEELFPNFAPAESEQR